MLLINNFIVIECPAERGTGEVDGRASSAGGLRGRHRILNSYGHQSLRSSGTSDLVTSGHWNFGPHSFQSQDQSAHIHFGPLALLLVLLIVIYSFGKKL